MVYTLTAGTQVELLERFGMPAPVGPEDQKSVTALHGIFENVAQQVCENTPMSRELSLCLTNLEQARFWAMQAVIRTGGRTERDAGHQGHQATPPECERPPQCEQAPVAPPGPAETVPAPA